MLNLCVITASCQSISYKNITINEGLVSNECYGILCDKDGYIWIRTVNGLCKYNGQSFKIFTTNEGLKSNEIYALCQDQEKRIWYGTGNCAIGYLKNDSVFTNKYFDSITKVLRNDDATIHDIESDDSLNIYIITNRSTFKIFAKYHYQKFQRLEYLTKNIYFEFKTYSAVKNILIHPVHDDDNKFFQKESIIFKINDKIYSIPWLIKRAKIGLNKKIFLVHDKKGDLYFNANNYLIKIGKNNTFKILDLKNLIHHLYISKKNDLYIARKNTGLIKFQDCNLESQPVNLLKENSVSFIAEDFESHIWVSTLENGIFKITDKYIISNFNSNHELSTRPIVLKSIQNSAYIINKNGLIFKINPINDKILNLNKYINNERAVNIFNLHNKFLIISNKKTAFYNKDFKLENIFFRNSKNIYKQLFLTDIEVNNTKMYAINRHYLGEMEKEHFTEQYHIVGYANAIQVLSDKVYVSSNYCISYLDSKHGLKPIIRNIETVKFLKTNNRLICVGKDGKILLIDTENKVRKINLTKSIFVNDVCLDSEDNLWIAAANGLYYVNLKHNTPSLINAQASSKEIFKICSANDFIFFGTKEGIFKLKENRMSNLHERPRLNLDNIRINDSISDTKKIKDLKFNENRLEINLNAISYLDDLTIKFKLSSVNQNFLSTSKSKLIYNDLDPGIYTFMAYSENQYSLRSIPLIIIFKINPSIYRTWWFICLEILILILTTFWLTHVILKRRKKKELKAIQIEKTISEYKLVSLRSQMNPHFIFNSLNSIQYYMKNRKIKYAYTYLSKYSSLMRQILLNSDKNLSVLQEEIDFINQYIEIEKMRFDHSFHFILTIEEGIDTYYHTIPSMLLQPYIENAIWHGLMKVSNDETKILKLEIEIDSEFLIFRISDNGVGIQKSKNQTHISMANKINEKRINAINSILDTNTASIQIVNLDKGTSVIIKIPV